MAYLVFIGQNLSSVFQGHGIALSSYIFLIAAVEVVLSWIGSLAALAPFSIFADICNAIAMGIVVKEDIQKAISGGISFKERTAITSNLQGLPFAGGMAVFCFEGFGMTLALESSMKDRAAFPKVLGQALVGITIVYVLFGFSGYMAYGDDTRDIITLNLPDTWSTKAVQVGLCVGLIFTFPMMLHPINEIVEGKLKQSNWFEKIEDNDNIFSGKRVKVATYISRAIIVLGLAILASFVPGFGVFASLVGSTICALISFVLPAIFHLMLMGSSLSLSQKVLDSFILICGLLFAAYGTYNSLVGI